jgi:hypothetical protein
LISFFKHFSGGIDPKTRGGVVCEKLTYIIQQILETVVSKTLNSISASNCPSIGLYAIQFHSLRAIYAFS